MPDKKKEEYLKDAREEFDHKVDLLIDDGPEELASLIHEPKEIAELIIDLLKESKGTERFNKIKEKFAKAELPSYVEEE